MAANLDRFSSNLKIDKFVNLKKYYNGNQLSLLFRKGVYPDNYVDSMTRLDETNLPPKEAFYCKLTDEGTDEDYQHAQTVWKEFNIESVNEGVPQLLHLSDVLLLADIFENIRNICMSHYEFDPAWYFSAPGVAWDAALTITKVQIELLRDPDMLLMIDGGIREGIATISHRHAKDNKEYMGTDPAEKSKFISYFDANNLYGWALSKQLPTSGF